MSGIATQDDTNREANYRFLILTIKALGVAMNFAIYSLGKSIVRTIECPEFVKTHEYTLFAFMMLSNFILIFGGAPKLKNDDEAQAGAAAS